MSYRTLLLSSSLAALALAACGNEAAVSETPADATPPASAAADLPYKISLAQWSLHKKYMEPGADPYAFPADAKAMGFEGVEYVSQLYRKDLAGPEADPATHRAKALAVAARLDSAARAADITQVLIMIDNEGDISSTDAAKRKRAIENHKVWIDAAANSGIPTVRLNAGGHGDRKMMHDLSVATLQELGAYAKTKNVNVVVENHGGNSSDPRFLRDVMAAVDMDNVGILPDFGNFCRERNDPKDWRSGCKDEVSRDSTYAAVGMWMPYAHAISAKSYDFDADGNETKIDFARMMDTVVAHGYTGFVGIEYEGEVTPEAEGIEATRALLQRGPARPAGR